MKFAHLSSLKEEIDRVIILLRYGDQKPPNICFA